MTGFINDWMADDPDLVNYPRVDEGLAPPARTHGHAMSCNSDLLRPHAPRRGPRQGRLCLLGAFLAASALLSGPIAAQVVDAAALYVLTTGSLGGAPEPGRYAVDLFRIRASQPAAHVRNVVPAHEGCHSVVADYESGIIVLSRPIAPEAHLEFIAMKAPSQSLSRRLTLEAVPSAEWRPHGLSAPAQDTLRKAVPGPRMTVVTQRTLLDRPGQGAWLALRLGNIDLGSANVAYSLADPARAPETIRPAELASMRISGTFGFGNGLGSSDTVVVESSEQGWVHVAGRDRTALVWPRIDGNPREAAFWSLLARNSQAAVIQVSRGQVHANRQPAAVRSAGFGRYRILRSNTGRWERLDFPGAEAHVRLIRNWLLAIVAEPKGDGTSPGSENRRKAAAKNAPGSRVATDAYFRSSHLYYPGLLFLMDTVSGRSWTIRTGEGDSEHCWWTDRPSTTGSMIGS